MISKKGFTLIELMISITIIGILSVITYSPYSYYQNKASLKVTAREVSQLLYESRNMAINGAIANNGNVAIGVYFDTSEIANTQIKVFSFPHNIDKLNITNTQGGDIRLIKTLKLQKGILIDKIEDKQNILFFFDSITGKLSYYNWHMLTRQNFEDDIVSINFSFKGSSSPNLNKTINYYTNTNIIDY
ncbi:MAG: prepilin-type N-terminal cleavage/methylation domain-containing protein [Candidatus Gracilibacteria bacterium]|nr:prepilin-type N-terminal cleavage/methylation domain-containing protein [Candidatus Gracilibacteria bacterium]